MSMLVIYAYGVFITFLSILACLLIARRTKPIATLMEVLILSGMSAAMWPLVVTYVISKGSYHYILFLTELQDTAKEGDHNEKLD